VDVPGIINSRVEVAYYEAKMAPPIHRHSRRNYWYHWRGIRWGMRSPTFWNSK